MERRGFLAGAVALFGSLAGFAHARAVVRAQAQLDQGLPDDQWLMQPGCFAGLRVNRQLGGAIILVNHLQHPDEHPGGEIRTWVAPLTVIRPDDAHIVSCAGDTVPALEGMPAFSWQAYNEGCRRRDAGEPPLTLHDLRTMPLDPAYVMK